jgi:hypothetical protein
MLSEYVCHEPLKNYLRTNVSFLLSIVMRHEPVIGHKVTWINTFLCTATVPTVYTSLLGREHWLFENEMLRGILR